MDNFILVVQLTSHHDGGHLPTEDYKLVTELRLVTTKYDEISNAEDSDPRFVIVDFFATSVSGTSLCDWPLSWLLQNYPLRSFKKSLPFCVWLYRRVHHTKEWPLPSRVYEGKVSTSSGSQWPYGSSALKFVDICGPSESNLFQHLQQAPSCIEIA